MSLHFLLFNSSCLFVVQTSCTPSQGPTVILTYSSGCYSPQPRKENEREKCRIELGFVLSRWTGPRSEWRTEEYMGKLLVLPPFFSLSLSHRHTHTYKILTHDLKLAPSFFGIIQKLERILHYCFFKNVLFSAIFCQNLAIPSLFLSKMGHLRPLFHILVFSTHFELLQQINVKKCPSNMGRRDSNPRPLKHELSPITTRPGLLPYLSICLSNRFAIISTISSKNEIRKTFISLGVIFNVIVRLKFCNSNHLGCVSASSIYLSFNVLQIFQDCQFF